MILPVLLVALSGAAPEPAVKLATTGFQFVNISPQLATFCTEHFAQQMTAEGIRVTTASEIATLLGFERQKELMGCTDKSTSCIAELANALGVDGLVVGTVGKFGKAYQVNVKVLSATDGRTLAHYAGRVRDEEAILDEYTKAAKKIAPELLKKMAKLVRKSDAPKKDSLADGVPMPPPPALLQPEPSAGAEVTQTVETKPGLRRYAWAPAAGGVAFLGVGTALLLTSKAKARAIGSGNLSFEEAQAAANSGKTLQTLSMVSFGVGAAALLTGGAFWLFGKDAPVQASASIAPGQAGVAIAGALP